MFIGNDYFKGGKHIKGRKIDSCAAGSCSWKLPEAVTPSLMLKLGVTPLPWCWLVAEMHLLCHSWFLCPLSHPCTSVPIVGGFGDILPLPTTLPHSSFLLVASSGHFGGFYPSPLGVQKVSVCHSLFQADLMMRLSLIQLCFTSESCSTVVMAGRVCPAQEFGEELSNRAGEWLARGWGRGQTIPELWPVPAVPCSENRMKSRREVAVRGRWH